MEKKRLGTYGLLLFVIILTGNLLLQPLKAAESQYGIWCPGCAKWQDHLKGVVETKSITKTEYIDGRVYYGNGEVSIACAECNKKLLRVKNWRETAHYSSETDEESTSWWEDYEVVLYTSDAIFPQLEAHLTGGSDEDESYRVIADRNIFPTNGYGWTEYGVFQEAAQYGRDLYYSLVDCLTLTQKSSKNDQIKALYAITDREFTWTEWYDSGLATDTSGNVSSGLIRYFGKFGIQASRQSSFQITFYANGGEGNMERFIAQSGANTLPVLSFTRKGYSFLGWAASPDGPVLCVDQANIEVSSDISLYAVWKKDKEPPTLTVTGEAEVNIYRGGNLVEGAVYAGDRVEIIPVKKQGREYADCYFSGGVTDAFWDNSSGKLSFTMPDQNVSAEVIFRDLRSLEVNLCSLFYETYQKAPYWDGKNFNLDCDPPITVTNEMLEVAAIFYHNGTGQTERRIQTDFIVVGSNQILSLGENTITVEADVLKDGYFVRGQCILQADSSSLSDLMEQTNSKTYTELKEFVVNLKLRLAECEGTIEELTSRLTISEEERERCSILLAESVAEVEKLTEELGQATEELSGMREELENVNKKLVLMQEVMEELTGNTEIDASTAEELKEKFQELKEENKGLEDKLSELEKEKEGLEDKVSGLEEEKAGLTDKVSGLEEEKAGLTDKVSGLEEEKAGLTDKVSGLEEEKAGLTDKVNGLEEEKAGLSDKVNGLEEEKAGLTKKVNGLEEEKTGLSSQLVSLQTEQGSLEARYKELLSVSEGLVKERDQLLQETEKLNQSKRKLEGQKKELESDIDYLKNSNSEFSRQLKYNQEEQKILLEEYEKLKKSYAILEADQKQKEEDYQVRISAINKNLASIKKEKAELNSQLLELEKEKGDLVTKWQKEKTELTASIHVLQKEKEKRAEAQQIIQNQEKENGKLNDNRPEGGLEEKAQEADLKEGQKLEENKQEELTEKVDEPETKEQETLGEETVAEERITEYQKDLSEQVLQEQKETMEKQGFARIVKEKEFLPGVCIMLVAMLLGGLVLYLFLEQKEKKTDYTCE